MEETSTETDGILACTFLHNAVPRRDHRL